MKTNRRLAGLLGWVIPALMAAALEPTGETAMGLQVGQQAPEFKLHSSGGGEVSLATLLERGPVAVVFFRSAQWCPYCQKQLAELQSSLAAIEATGGSIVGISYDSAATLKRFAEKAGIKYPLLSDPGSRTIDAYGIRNTEAPDSVKGIPHPGTFVISTDRQIRARLFLEGYKERHGIEALLGSLRAARGPISPTAAQ